MFQYIEIPRDTKVAMFRAKSTCKARLAVYTSWEKARLLYRRNGWSDWVLSGLYQFSSESKTVHKTAIIFLSIRFINRDIPTQVTLKYKSWSLKKLYVLYFLLIALKHYKFRMEVCISGNLCALMQLDIGKVYFWVSVLLFFSKLHVIEDVLKWTKIFWIYLKILDFMYSKILDIYV